MKLIITVLVLGLTVVGFTQQAAAVAEKDFIWYCESDEATEAQKATVSEIYYSFGIDQDKVGCKEALKKINEGYFTCLNFNAGSQLTDLSPIEGLKKIKTIKCNVCTQSAFDTIPPIPSLTSLDFWKSELSSFTNLERFPNIKELRLASTQVKDLSELNSIQNLRSLNISNLDASVLGTLPLLDKLELLSMGEMGLRRVPDASMTPNVKELFLDGNELVSVEGIKNFKSLRSLGLSGNLIRSLGVNDLPSDLTALYLYTPSYDDYSFLKGLTNLKDLQIGYSKTIKWEEFEHLIPQLEELNLFYSNIGPKMIPENTVELWKNMKSLTLDGTSVDSLAFFKQVKAPKLETIGIPNIEEKNEENCPTSGVPVPVAKFCKEK